METLRIGILGVSNHFVKRIVLPLQNTMNCEVYAIASRDRDKALSCAEKFNIPQVFNSYEDLIKSDSVDAIYIPLPNSLHLKYIKISADHKKPIICEKPIALNAKEAFEAVDYCKKANVPLIEAFMYKYHPLWQHIKKIIDTNQVGSIQYINTLFSYNNPNSSNIRNKKELGGGAYYDVACYACSVPRFLIGREPKRVVSASKFHSEFETDVLSSAILDFDSCHATFTCSTAAHSNQRVEIVCSSGKIVVPVPFNTYVDCPSQIVVESSQGTRTINFGIADQYGIMFDEFSNSVLNDLPLEYGAEDAYLNMKVMDSLFNSLDKGGWAEV